MSRTGYATIKLFEVLWHEAASLLVRHGEQSETADRLSRATVVEIAQQMQGQVYFAKNREIEAQAKHRLIRADYNQGNTPLELAEKYSLSPRRIHSILFELQDDAKMSAGSYSTIMTLIAKMMLKSGAECEDAINAARGFVAILAARYGGRMVRFPVPRVVTGIMLQIEVYRMFRAGKSVGKLAAAFNQSETEIQTIINSYPVKTTHSETANSLSFLKKQIVAVAIKCRDDPDIHSLLENAANSVGKAEQMVCEENTKHKPE